MQVGDLVVSSGGRVMRIVAIGDDDLAALVPASDPDQGQEHSYLGFLHAPPEGADQIYCMGCLKYTFMWVDYTRTITGPPLHQRLIRCARCYVDSLCSRPVELHRTGSRVEPRHLTKEWWR